MELTWSTIAKVLIDENLLAFGLSKLDEDCINFVSGVPTLTELSAIQHTMPCYRALAQRIDHETNTYKFCPNKCSKRVNEL